MNNQVEGLLERNSLIALLGSPCVAFSVCPSAMIQKHFQYASELPGKCLKGVWETI